jgi:transposase
MGEMAVTEGMLAAKFGVILPHLDERQRRLALAAEARMLGHGGIRLVARAAGVSEVTVSLGVAELEAGAEPLGRARRPGGGRKRSAGRDPGLVAALLALVEPEERGNPMSPLRWTTKSTRTLAGELTRQGHEVSADTVGDLLRAEGFSLQGNAKTIEGRRHPDRDAQFRYINGQVAGWQDAGDPVISVDTKKKELVGEFGNAGRQWRPEGGVCQRFRARDFSVPGSGCLSGLSQPRYLKLFRPVYPWPAPNRTYRALPGLILRVPVIFPFSAIRVTPPCPPGPPDVHSGSVI